MAYETSKMIYRVVVKADAPSTDTRQIVGWESFSENNPPPAQSVDYTTIDIPNMDEAHWPPSTQPNDISNMGIDVKGAIVPHAQPPYVPPLKEQAASALQTTQQQASMVVAMGGTFGPTMRDYVTKLRAIINGTDTTSTELPNAPSDATT